MQYTPRTVMALLPGARLGSYEIGGALGAGGMGEVYRAKDVRLGREVAIKILSAAILSEPDRIARFEREAQTLAALNHPNIAHLYGFEDGPPAFLAMELVEGPTLAERIALGSSTGAPGLPVADVLSIGRQVAEALEAAHERGIIHRDLKPANIKVTDDGTVKVLDFGLAKALGPDGSGASGEVANSPTLTARATQLGVILGTAAYMAPEQAKGKVVDRRADIWAFGVVMHEMLTGDRPFKGEDISDTLAAVLRQDIVWTALPATTPPRLRRLLERCLDRDVKTRLRDIGEARIELARLQSGTTDAMDASAAAVTPAPAHGLVPPNRSTRPWILGALGGVVAATLATWLIMRPTPAPAAQPMRFAFVPSATTPLNLSTIPDRIIAASPIGTHLAYVTAEGGLVVRAMDRLNADAIPGIALARGPFFSWDGQWIGFNPPNELRKVSVTGGPSVLVCPVTTGVVRGASWGPDDVIVFGTSEPNSGLMAVSAGGGEPKALTTPVAPADHWHPFVLPNGKILFTITAGQVENSQVAVLDPKTGAIKVLIRGGSQPEYIEPAGGPGYLVYGAAGSLRAVRFDLQSLEVKGDAIPVVDQVATTTLAAVDYAVSRTGTLVYLPGDFTNAVAQRTLAWMDRRGNESAIKAPVRAYYAVRIAPDGTRAVLDIRDQQNDVWIWNFARETLSPLTFDANIDGFPIWTPDSQRIIFGSQRTGPYNLYVQAADGTGTAMRLTTSAQQHVPAWVSADGASMAMVQRTGVNDDIGMWTKDKPEFVATISSPTSEKNAEVSPDGQWIAYESFESTPPQIYVRPFPDVNGGKWQISRDGGVRPVWNPKGRELFFLSGATGATVSLYAVAIPTTPKEAGNPVKLFDVTNLAGQQNGRFYDVSRDGQKFMVIKSPAPKEQTGGAQQTLVVVANWFEELKGKFVK
jgi:serine/threonine-protein kinase